MAWMKPPAENVALFDELVAEQPLALRRSMFGCPCAFVNGNMAFGLHEDHLVLRLADAEREALLASGEATPFIPMEGRRMREYVVAPPPWMADKDLLATWIDRSVDYVARLPPKAPKARAAKAPKAKAPKAR